MEGMCHANNIMVIQMSQLGQIDNLEDQVWILTNKVMEQGHVITNLVSDNLEHLQDNMRLTAHINSSQTRMGNLKHQLEELGDTVDKDPYTQWAHGEYIVGTDNT